MASLTDFNYTDNMAAAKKPLLTDLRETLDSFETRINVIQDNQVQLANDCFPSAAYSYDGDGNKNYANFDLYDKQTSSSSYSGGDTTISTTGAWTDVDATNAKITFTPDLAGDFRVTFQFNLESANSNATNETNIRFRLTDGTTASDATPRVRQVTMPANTTATVPVYLSQIYSSLAASATTVKLQYFISTTTNTTIKVLSSSNDKLSMEVEKV